MRIEAQLMELELFLKEVEGFLRRQAERSQTDDERRKLEEYFPNLLRSSLFVTIYATIENEMNRICAQLAKDDGLGVEDLRGNGIIRASNFLTKVCRVDFPEGSEEWSQLKEYNQLRNILVHENGRDKGNQLTPLVEASSGLRQDKDGSVRLGRQFCPEVLATARGFFTKVSAALGERTE